MKTDTFVLLLLFFRICTIILAIYKTRNTGTGNGMRGMWGMFTRIPGNVTILTFRGMFQRIPEMLKKIPGNVQEDSGECRRRFRGMFRRILGNVRKDSAECSKRFRAFLKKIPGNAQEDSGEC